MTKYCAEGYHTADNGEGSYVYGAHIEESIEAVDPTCTTSGWTEGKKCSVCDLILEAPEEIGVLEHNYGYANVTDETHDKVCSVGGETATEAHEYVDGKCACGATEAPAIQPDSKLRFYTNALDLKAAISAQFIPYPDNNFKTYERVYIVVESEGKEPATYESLLMGSTKYFQFGIIACEMDVEYTVTLYGEKNGQTYQGATISNWSVKNKAIEMLNNNIGKYNTADQSKKDCDLAANLLSFGAEAQKRFLGKSGEQLVTYGLPAEYAALIKTDAVEFEAMPTWTDNGTVKIQTSALNMKDRIELFMMFRGVSDFTGYYAKVEFNGTTTDIPLELYTASGKVYKQYGMFNFSGLTAGQLKEDVSITIYNTADEAVSITYTYSVENKASTMQTATDGELVKAMMHYGNAAKARFG